MAEKAEETSSQNIVCPLCLDVFDDASMLICEHTFCSKCLERYDAAHRDMDHMVCPLCRKATKLDEKRVSGLPTNVTVKGLVDEYHTKHGGINAVLEGRPKCTACELQGDAVSFCYECSNYMCAKCDHGHSQLTSFFKGHQVVSMTDVMEGNASIGQVPHKCLVHKHENKDLFCEDCKIYICLKCMIVDHRDHKIKNQSDVEKELQKKVDNIVTRSNDRKNEFEKHIQDIESKRQEIYAAIQKLQGNIKEAFNSKVEKLTENKGLLLAKTHSLQDHCDKELDALKALDRQKIKAISSSVSLVANDRLGQLEKDSLAAHSLICTELDSLLEDGTNEKSATDISGHAKFCQLVPAGDTLLDIGTLLNRGNMTLKQEVDVSNQMSGITPLSGMSIAVGYSERRGVDKVDINGSLQTCIQTGEYFCDVAHQNKSILVVARNYNTFHLYNSNDWSKVGYQNISNETGSPRHPKISISHDNEIIAANRYTQIHIYDPTASTRKLSITTVETPMQARGTKSGLIVTSSCDKPPSIVRVYDRDGNKGEPIVARQGEYLYPAVDSEDRVYVASVNQPAGTIQITLYHLQGLNLNKMAEFEELTLTLQSSWCYLVSLSPNTLAFACYRKVYFLTIPYVSRME